MEFLPENDNPRTAVLVTAIAAMLGVFALLQSGCREDQKHYIHIQEAETKKMEICLKNGGQWVIPYHKSDYMCVVSKVNDTLPADSKMITPNTPEKAANEYPK